MAAGSVWLLVKVSTVNKYDNCLSSLTVYELHELFGQPNIYFEADIRNLLCYKWEILEN